MGLSVLFPFSQEAMVFCVAVSLVIASLLIGVDVLMIRATWALHGLGALRSVGSKFGGGVKRAFTAVMYFVSRVGISYSVARLIAMLLMNWLFAPDILAEIHKQNLRDNAPIVIMERQRAEETIANQRAFVTSVSHGLTGVRNALQSMPNLDQTAEEPELKSAVEKLSRLETAKAAEEENALRFTRMSIHELRGLHDNTSESGLKGPGDWYKARLEEAKLASSRAEEIGRQIDASRQQVVQLRVAKANEDRDARQRADAQRTDLVSREASTEASLNAAQKKLLELEASKEAAILAAVRDSENYATEDQGPLARFAALYRLMLQPSTKWVLTLFEFFIMGLELTSILAKMLILIPTTYAVNIAANDFLQAPMIAVGNVEKTREDVVVEIWSHAAKANRVLHAARPAQRRTIDVGRRRKRRDAA